MFDLVPTPDGWRFDRRGPDLNYAPDLDMLETVEIAGGRTYVNVSARLARETVTVTFCLDALLWPVEDGDYEGAANEHLYRVRRKVVLRARAILSISLPFEIDMELLRQQLRPQAVPA